MQTNVTEGDRRHVTYKLGKHCGAHQVWRSCKEQNAAGKNVQRPWMFAKQPGGQRPQQDRREECVKHLGPWA